MWLDVVDLRDFYGGALGRLVRRLIARQIRDMWPTLVGQRVAGVGFATPYLASLRDDAERVMAVMPPGQGVMRWPDDAPSLTCLAEEFALPFPDRAIDRLLIVHCLEATAQPQLFMRECWRVLADGGRVMFVVANRRGLWARFEPSPFAHGRPYSQSQLMRALRDGMFTPRQTATAVFLPPVMWRLFAGWAAALDRIGARWAPTFAGVHIVEAEKQIYAVPLNALLKPARSTVGAVRPAVDGIGQSSTSSRGIEA
ncbi:MAG: class I SAM-dependent methyltransferase [Rhodospirillaceae bacterium]|nr:class I SAM-dependent methyltransferase [Rhodospirillaceae bacterium]